jgi:hypothetical protein
MRQPLFHLVLFVTLSSSVSAQALSYTISASASWTFSGIPVDLEPFAGGVFDKGVCAPQFDPCDPASLPGTGSVALSVDNSSNGHVFTTALLIAPGHAFIDAHNVMSVTALQPGWSTITFTYQVQETGIVPVGGILTASASVFAEGHGLTTVSQLVQTTVPADQSFNIARTITGTSTGSVFCAAIGTCSSFGARTASSVQYVPVPNMLWPTLIGMVAIGILGRRRQISDTMTH